MFSKLTNLFRRSIANRIAALFSLVFALCLAAAFTITYFVVSDTLENASHQVIQLKLEEITSVLHAGGPEGLHEFFDREDRKELNAPFLFRLTDAQGKVLFLKPSVQEKHFDFSEVTGSKVTFPPPLGWKALQAVDDEDMFDLLSRQLRSGLFLQVGKSGEDRQGVLETLTLVFAGLGLLFTLGAALFSRWYARRSLAPLHHLLGAIRQIEAGNLKERLPEQAPDEVNELGRTFNRMAAKIESLILGMKNSLDNVAHEIRTPLTRVRGVAEQALVAGDPAGFREALEECTENVTELSDLVAQLMSISEAEAGTLSLSREPCAVAEVIEEVAQVYEFVAQEKNIELKLRLAPTVFPLDRRRFKQVVGNLLDNALKFSPANSVVLVQSTEEADQLSLRVGDEGPGIPASELPHIWKRLYRGDKSRSSRGTGLGLAIVQAIVVAHGGAVTAESKPTGGALFTVRLPKI